MNYHIIRTGESLEKIAYGYNLDIEEITRINKHITNWQKLIPGTKIRLPEISNQLTMELDEVEPFIEDYYPKIKLPIKEEPDNEVALEKIEVKQEEKIIEPVKNKKQFINYYPGNPFYNYPYPYGYNYYRYYTKPKKRSR